MLPVSGAFFLAKMLRIDLPSDPLNTSYYFGLRTVTDPVFEKLL